MHRRRDRILLWAFTLLLGAWMVAQGLAGAWTGLLHVAPVLLLVLLLVLGRYPGEQTLARCAGAMRKPPSRSRARVLTPRSYVRVMQRGGGLVAWALAKRPPPRAPASLSTA